MKVRYNEGVAIHIGPEPCIVGREVRDEASAGERTGQPLSRESSILSQVPTPFVWWKATRTGALAQVPVETWRGRRPWHVRTLLAREPGDPTFDRWRMPPRSASGR